MNARLSLSALVWLMALPGIAVRVVAQPTSGATEAAWTQPASTVTNAPALPPFQSPVAFFRELLKVSPAEVAHKLADRAPDNRERIQAKLREYAALTPDQRELRLRVTEIHWYLRNLISLPREQRDERVKLIPEPDRKLVEDRLQRWSLLPPPLQQGLLENEMTLQYLTRLEGDSREQPALLLSDIALRERKKLGEALDRWDRLPPHERDQMQRTFNWFFDDLSGPEKERILGTLSENERLEMQKTLDTFQRLPRERREQCIRSFGKLAELNPAERHQFLRNAGRWQAMTPEERQAWREVVRQLPETQMPPLPMGFDASRLPPMPQSAPGVLDGK